MENKTLMSLKLRPKMLKALSLYFKKNQESYTSRNDVIERAIAIYIGYEVPKVRK